ncbi:MAG: hypothetical protein U0263_27975 [Polyangiaceae bacterium]
MRPAVLLLALLGSLALSACETPTRRGSTLYADGRYVEAAEVFERTEYRLREYSPRERAEYGLYRGMTMLVLGDLPSARRWFAYAYDVERIAPGSLRADRRALLDRGWFDLGQRQRSELEHAVKPSDGAVASRQPPPPPPPAQDPPATAVPPANVRTLVPR